MTNQPHLLVIGSCWSDISDFYVILEEDIIACDTVLGAIDLLFKIFHVLNAQYPKESVHIWLTIQKFVYNITTKTDKVIPYVETLIQQLNASD